MSRSHFIDLVNEFCALADVDQPILLVQGHPLEVDGVDFFVQYDEHSAPEQLALYCAFGPPAPERLLDAYQALLEANMILSGTGTAAFMLGPDQQVLFNYQCRLLELKAAELLGIFRTLAEQARAWRSGYFLTA